MSKIGKAPIDIPSGVETNIDNGNITIKGPKGSLAFSFSRKVKVKKEGSQIIIEKVGGPEVNSAYWGTARALIANIVEGVTKGFEKKLELFGVGYKMTLQGKKLVLNLGFSHPIEKVIPDGLELALEKEVLVIKGIDKYKVGQFAAEIRSLKKVEPYKGKGFRYAGEQFIKKEGKKTAASE